MMRSSQYWDAYVNQEEWRFFENQDMRALTDADIEQQVADYVREIPSMFNYDPHDLAEFERERDDIQSSLVDHLKSTRGSQWDVAANA